MPRQFKFEGKVYSLPDGISDQEALDFISSSHLTSPTDFIPPSHDSTAGNVGTPKPEPDGFWHHATETLRTLPQRFLSGEIIPDTLNALGPKYMGEYLQNPNANTLRRAIPFVGATEDTLNKPIQTAMQGNIPGALGDVADIGVNVLGGRLLHALPENPSLSVPVPSTARATAVVKGAAKGAVKGGMESVPAAYGIINRLGGGGEINVPAFLRGAETGAAAGAPFGRIAATAGGGVGALAPFVKGAVKGGKAAATLFDRQSTPLTPAQQTVIEAFRNKPDLSPVAPQSVSFVPVAPEPGTFRAPGGPHNVPRPAPPRPPRAPAVHPGISVVEIPDFQPIQPEPGTFRQPGGPHNIPAPVATAARPAPIHPGESPVVVPQFTALQAEVAPSGRRVPSLEDRIARANAPVTAPVLTNEQIIANQEQALNNVRAFQSRQKPFVDTPTGPVPIPEPTAAPPPVENMATKMRARDAAATPPPPVAAQPTTNPVTGSPVNLPPTAQQPASGFTQAISPATGSFATDFQTKAKGLGVNEPHITGAEESGLVQGLNVTNKNANLLKFAKSKNLPNVPLTEAEYNTLVTEHNKENGTKYKLAGADHDPRPIGERTRHGRSAAQTLKEFNDQWAK